MMDLELALAITAGIWTAFGLFGGWLYLRSQAGRWLLNSDLLLAFFFVLCGPFIPLLHLAFFLEDFMSEWLRRENIMLTKLFGRKKCPPKKR